MGMSALKDIIIIINMILKPLAKCRSVLIIRPEGSLGDSIITSCFYRELKKANPKLKISVVCFGASFLYLKDNIYIDRIYRLPIKRVLRPHQRIISLLILGLRLGFTKFDIVIDDGQKNYLNYRMFRTLIGRNRILDSRSFGYLGNSLQERTKIYLCKLTDRKDPDISYDIQVAPDSKRYLKEFLRKYNIGFYICFNMFASVKERSINGNTVSVLDVLFRKYLESIPVFCVFRPGQKTVWENIIKTYGLKNYYLFETRNISDLLAAVIDKNDFILVSPDSAAVHAASPFRIKTLVFYDSIPAAVGCKANNDNATEIYPEKPGCNNFDIKELEKAFCKIIK